MKSSAAARSTAIVPFMPIPSKHLEQEDEMMKILRILKESGNKRRACSSSFEDNCMLMTERK